MKNLSVLFTLVLITITSGYLQSQSLFMRSGEGAFMATAQRTNQKNIVGNSLGMAVSLRGVVDIGVSFSKLNMNQMLGYQDVEEYGFTPYMNIFWVKQSRGYSPISIFSGVQYQQMFMNSNALNVESPLRAQHKELINTAGIAHNIDLSYTTSIMPVISAQYSYGKLSYSSISDQGKTELYQNEGNLSDIRTSEYGMSIALPIQIGAPGGSRLIIEPSYAYTNLNQQMTIKLGAILAPRAKGRCKGGICPVFRR
jgi:hypothetical protein